MAIKYEIRNESGESAHIGGLNCFASKIDAQREIDWLLSNGWGGHYCVGEYKPSEPRDDDDDIFEGGEYQSESYRCNDREYYRE